MSRLCVASINSGGSLPENKKGIRALRTLLALLLFTLLLLTPTGIAAGDDAPRAAINALRKEYKLPRFRWVRIRSDGHSVCAYTLGQGAMYSSKGRDHATCERRL